MVFAAVLVSSSCNALNPLVDSVPPDMSGQSFQKATSSVLLSLTPAASASGEEGDTWILTAKEAMRLSRKDVRAAARDLGNASYSLELKDANNGFLVQRRAALKALEAAGLQHHRTFFNASGFITTSTVTRGADGLAAYYQINALVIEPTGCSGGANQDAKGLYCTIYITSVRVELSNDAIRTLQDPRSVSLVKAVAETFER